jgi:dihydroxyacetone kinase-like protein
MTEATTTIDIGRLIAAVADTIAVHADELTALDQAIGDGDHGLNMKRGFEAVQAEAAEIAAKRLPDAVRAVGTKLVMKVGGASGPLFGTLFMTLGKELPADPDRAAFSAALAKAVDAVAERGKSQAGQKTMLDVLYPVSAALAEGKSAADIVAIADDAVAATKPMKAIRGRAAFLGERSIGHIDPGARSSALITRAVADVLGGGA